MRRGNIWSSGMTEFSPLSTVDEASACFTWEADELSVDFDASCSISGSGTITHYHWDFGDGDTQTTTIPTVTHVYDEAGAYAVQMYVTDDVAGDSLPTGDFVSVDDAPVYVPAAYAIGISTGVISTTCNKIAFATDTRTVLPSGMSISRDGPGGYGNTGVNGYAVSGGQSITFLSADRWSAPTDTRTLKTGAVLTARIDMAGMEDDGVAGYAVGGQSSSDQVDTIDKMAFSGETTSILSTGLASIRSDAGAAGNPGVAGYVFGGVNPPQFRSDNNKFAFPTDTRSITTPFSSVYIDTGMCDAGVAIYAKGVNFTPYSTSYAKMLVPSDTNVGAGAVLSEGRGRALTACLSGSHGYIMGGAVNSGGLPSSFRSTIDKIAFPSDTPSTLGTGLSVTGIRGTSFAI